MFQELQNILSLTDLEVNISCEYCFMDAGKTHMTPGQSQNLYCCKGVVIVSCFVSIGYHFTLPSPMQCPTQEAAAIFPWSSGYSTNSNIDVAVKRLIHI